MIIVQLHIQCTMYQNCWLFSILHLNSTHTHLPFLRSNYMPKMWLVPTDHYQPDVHVPAMLLICLTHIGDPSTEKARLATS